MEHFVHQAYIDSIIYPIQTAKINIFSFYVHAHAIPRPLFLLRQRLITGITLFELHEAALIQIDPR